MLDGYYWYIPTAAETNDLRGLDHAQPVKVEDSEVALIQTEITHALVTFEGVFVPLDYDLERAVIEAAVECRKSNLHPEDFGPGGCWEAKSTLTQSVDALIAARKKQ